MASSLFSNSVRWSTLNTDGDVVTSSSAWTPADITTRGWWDASDATTMAESSGSVASMADKSGSGNALIGGSGNRPETGARTLNGLNVLDFANNDKFRNTSFSFSADGNILIVMVAEIDEVRTNTDSLVAYEATQDFQLNSNNGSSFNGEIDVTGGVGADAAYTYDFFPVPAMHSITFDLGNGEYYGHVDGTQKSSTVAMSGAVSTSGSFYVFVDRTNTNELDGAFAELVICDDPSTATRQKIEGYLAHKWGLEVNLPSDHPYKSSAP